MRHCVSTYAQDCRSGECRIYSITDTEGNRIATLEAQFSKGEEGGLRAHAAQLRGSCNQRVEDQGALKATQEVIKALNKTLEAQLKAASESAPDAAPEPGAAPSILPALAWRREAARQEQALRPEAIRFVGIPGGHL